MKNDKLNGKVAVVTGASKGIGADIAKQFAADGAAVVVNYASDKQGADRVVDDITKRGGKALAVQANVAKRSEVERLFAAAEKAFGKTDVLVNNAGVYEFVPLEEVTEQQFHRMFDTNVLGMLLVTQEEHSENVCIKHSMKLLLGDFFQRDELIHAGVIDQNVGFAERFLRRCKESLNF